MNKKQSGLLNAMPQQGGLINAMPESEVDRNKREARDAFITSWKKENSDFVRDMKKWTKLQLVELLIRRMVGDAYDKVLSELSENDAQVEINAYVALTPILLKGTPEERLSALAKLEAEMISNAGGSTIKVAKIAHIAGMAEMMIKVQHKTKAFKVRDANLAEGRKGAVKIRQEKATKKQELLINSIAALFDKPEKPGWGWSNPEIVQFLMKSNYGYADSVILQTVKREAAKYRKVRKEQQASQLLNR